MEKTQLIYLNEILDNQLYKKEVDNYISIENLTTLQKIDQCINLNISLFDNIEYRLVLNYIKENNSTGDLDYVECFFKHKLLMNSF